MSTGTPSARGWRVAADLLVVAAESGDGPCHQVESLPRGSVRVARRQPARLHDRAGPLRASSWCDLRAALRKAERSLMRAFLAVLAGAAW
jgi:hypothetical protein